MKLNSLYIGLGAIVGSSVPVVAGTNYWIQEDIWSQVSDEAFPESMSDSSSIWTGLQKKLKNNSVAEFNDTEIQNIKNKSEDNPQNGDAIKQWCLKSYKKVFKNLFLKNTKLVDNVRNICVWTISDQLGSSSILDTEKDQDNPDKSTYDNHLNSLKSHEETKSKLDKQLYDLKKKISSKTDADDWKELKNWCRDMYKKGYQGKTTIEWELVNIYCKK